MLPPISIERPESVAEASAMLREYGPDAAVYAGGTELLILLKERLVDVSRLIDIKAIGGLDQISYDASSHTIRIGALATHWQLERSDVVRQHAPVLADLENQIANVRVRLAGTIGGNLCFAEPHSDPATLLTAWGASVRLESERGSREMPIGEFLRGYLETALGPEELLTSIVVPVPAADTGASYLRFKSHERPVATVAATVQVDKGEIAACQLVVGSVSATPQPLESVETMLAGQRLEPDVFRAAGDLAMETVEADEEGFESPEYKRHLTGVLVRRALGRASRRTA